MPLSGGTIHGDLIFPNNDISFQMTKNNGKQTKFFVTNEGALASMDNKFGGYTPDSKSMCYPQNRPYKPIMLGAQDDILLYAHKRGVTITQTSSHPRDYGANEALFTFDSEDAIRWDATNATEANPITLEVDLTTDREIVGGYQYCFYFGMNSTWTNFAKNLIIEVYDATPAQWITVLDIRDNTTENFVCSSSWDGIDKAQKIRVKFWGANNNTNRIAYTRLFALSTKTQGQAWFPKSGGIVNGDATFEGKTTAKGGLVIETRTTDPFSPEIGRMWLRSDL
ncbi:hypothetical protein COJ85_32065 [Bacillus sp. AFS076308]|uniref:hypothetical protein n=1 Tax=unclassified Bacillus (in: firmicutes) TaxID=185979 RepID=UPI000BFA3A90|nr:MULTISPECIES: hypothetical protein [unclassified Bacillus (in: firmicutes)]PFN77606.1 hypothetical protein COJ85_32065 [Bacillus sp. AFS076308]PGV45313.1 hypothetical protein COD92_30855 [Bacillus sp. AFS037270]